MMEFYSKKFHHFIPFPLTFSHNRSNKIIQFLHILEYVPTNHSFRFKVYDTLPESIFQPYDVPVDYIVTPTEIIKVENRPPRPLGIIWNLLSQRKLNLMSILKSLKERGEEWVWIETNFPVCVLSRNQNFRL